MKNLKHVGTEMALHVLAYNMKRVMQIVGDGGLGSGLKTRHRPARKFRAALS
jgi:hypothetical protein